MVYVGLSCLLTGLVAYYLLAGLVACILDGPQVHVGLPLCCMAFD
jgi:hypothetical protein